MQTSSFHHAGTSTLAKKSGMMTNAAMTTSPSPPQAWRAARTSSQVMILMSTVVRDKVCVHRLRHSQSACLQWEKVGGFCCRAWYPGLHVASFSCLVFSRLTGVQLINEVRSQPAVHRCYSGISSHHLFLHILSAKATIWI